MRETYKEILEIDFYDNSTKSKINLNTSLGLENDQNPRVLTQLSPKASLQFGVLIPVLYKICQICAIKVNEEVHFVVL